MVSAVDTGVLRSTIVAVCLLAAAGLLVPNVSIGQSNEAEGPDLTVREIHVKKDRPDESFPTAGTALTLWVKDTLGTFSSVVPGKTNIATFRDNEGTNLIQAHEKAIQAWNEQKARYEEEGRFVSTSRSRELYETKGFDDGFSEDAAGFYLRVESWGLPAPDATELHVSGTVTYLLGLDERSTKTFSDLVFADTKTLTVGGKTIKVTPRGEGEKTRQLRLKTALAVESFKIKNDQGEEIGSIRMTVNDQPIVSMPADAYSQPVTAEVTYKKPKTRTVDIDETVSVGLP